MYKTSKIIKSGLKSHFVLYREGNFIYRTDSGFEFPIPLEDIEKATLLAEDKTIYLMRWIRRHVELLNEMERVAKEIL